MFKRLIVLCCAVLAGPGTSYGQELTATSTIPAQLTLSEALRLAEERNPALAAVRAGITMAEGDRLSAGRRPVPAFTFDSIGQYPFKSDPIDSHEYLFRADQEIETRGRRQLRITAAQQGVNTAQAAYDDELRRLQLDVRRAYLQASLAKADRDVAQATLGEIDNLIKLNRARFEQGEVSGSEPRRLQVERLRFVDDVFAADLAFRNARSALLALINAPDLAFEFDPIDPLLMTAPSTGPASSTVTTALADISALRARALANRPTVMAARSEETRAQTETRLQRALRSPNVTVGGGFSHLGGLNVAAFGVTVPLTFLSRNNGAVVRADAEYEQARQRTAATLAVVALDVQQAVNAARVSRARVEYIEREHLTTAREARDIVLASYRLGEIDLIDYLDAQRAFRDTQRTYNRALYDARLSLFELDAAVGTTGAFPFGGQ